MAKCKKHNEPTYTLHLSKYEAEVLADLLYSHVAFGGGTLDHLSNVLRMALDPKGQVPPSRLRNVNKGGTYEIPTKRNPFDVYSYSPASPLLPTPSRVTRYEKPHAVLEENNPRD